MSDTPAVNDDQDDYARFEQWDNCFTETLPGPSNLGGVPCPAPKPATNDSWDFCLAPTSHDASFDLMDMQDLDVNNGTQHIGDLFSTDLTFGPHSHVHN